MLNLFLELLFQVDSTFMIIRNRTTKTLEASPLNNRGCAVPPDRDKKGNIDPEGVAHYAVRALFQSACLYRACYPGVLATLVPSVTKAKTALRSLWWYDCG